MPFALIFVLAVACCSPAFAQTTDPQRPSNAFAQLFPNPTGRNGYEELVRAGDMAKNSAVWRAYEKLSGNAGPVTLTMKRNLVSDSGVRSILSMVRSGLKKPITSPHVVLDDETILPELGLFRSLTRLLGVEMYVLLADGKVSQAIGTLEDALRFSYAIHSDTLIHGLVSIAMDAFAVKQLSDHLDQLSSRDCDRLLALAREWMNTPDPGPALLEKERGNVHRLLAKYRNDPEKLLKGMSVGEEGTPAQVRLESLTATLRANPAAAGPIFEEAGARADAHYEQVIGAARRPTWERADLPKPKDDGSPAYLVFEALVPNLASVFAAHARGQAKIQLLGVHAAIRRYRWEYSRLPGSLEELKLGPLGIDPFSGQPFVYKRLDDRAYELSSVGPYDRGTTDTPPTGQRVPVRL